MGTAIDLIVVRRGNRGRNLLRCPPKNQIELPAEKECDLLMPEKWILTTSVAFGDVDRDGVLTLSRVFKLLQEAAIGHANQYDTGTDAMVTRGESWVLSRVAVAIDRYPGYGEPLRVETWSSGIEGFKGFRDFRVFDGSEHLVVSGSSLWIYVSVRTRTILRVPRAVADRFPRCDEGVFAPDLETMDIRGADTETAAVFPLSVRYADIDANGHVNNTAYLDLLQTALVRQEPGAAHPRRVRIKYGRGIPAEAEAVELRLATATAGERRFSVAFAGAVAAQGDVA